ncbi:hypothetical protein IGK74_001117 [Enterococcus sp. AZ150]|uniref:hypothetical protein n=1 Tax=Enterococcus sp. AZ150 TaxID=2774866 RepID=UPI003F26F479
MDNLNKFEEILKEQKILSDYISENPAILAMKNRDNSIEKMLNYTSENPAILAMKDVEDNLREIKNNTETSQNIMSARISEISPSLFTESMIDNQELVEYTNPVYSLIEKAEEGNELLKEIKENTDSIKVIAEFVRESNLKQEELQKIVLSMLDIMKAKDQKEAEKLFKKTLRTINETVESVESITKLVAFTGVVYKLVENFL